MRGQRSESVPPAAGLAVGLVLGFAAAWALLSLFGHRPTQERPASVRSAEVRSLLAAGAAQAEIDQWSEALEHFQRAAELAPGEPATAFDVALALLRGGDAASAGEWVERAAAAAPAAFRPRVEYLRGRLAYERGNPEAAAAAYRRAVELAPREAAYPYALAQIALQLDEIPDAEHGALLERAYRLWPENLRLGAEYALWALGSDDPLTARQGREVLDRLVASVGRSDVAEWAERGSKELAAGAAPGIPVSYRRALNLLRPDKRYQADSAALEARLQVRPLAAPVLPQVLPRRALTSPAITFSVSELLPALALDSGERVLQAAPLVDVENLDAEPPREASLVVATDRRLLFLERRADEWSELARLGSPVERLEIGDLDGDGRMEIVALTAGGLSIRRRAADAGDGEQASETRSLPGAWSDLLLHDFEHDGDLDLLLRAADGRLLLALNRGEAGVGDPEPAPLPLPPGAAVTAVAAGDLDGDADQDLVVATGGIPAGGELLVLLNWRQGDYAVAHRLPVAAPAESMAALDYDGDGLSDLVSLAGGEPAFRRNNGGGELREDRVAQAGAAEAGAALVAASFGAADLDLDGDLDLVLWGAETGETLEPARSTEAGAESSFLVTALENGGWGRFLFEPALAPEAGDVRGVLPLDLDGDRDADLLVWDETGLRALEGRGAERQRWLALSLAGLAGKVPLDGRGARVEVSGTMASRSLEVRRPEVIVGLGDESPSVVKITWPNGISEYLFDPEPDQRHRVEQVLRLEGSCPFLYASDGSRLRFVTDILGLSPLGMLAAPGVYVRPDPEEYLRLPDWVAPAGNRLELRITEELREAAYLDQAELLVVEAPAGVEVYNHERWLRRPVTGPGLVLTGPLRPPVSVSSHDGREVLEIVAEEDARYLTNDWEPRRYQGAVTEHRLTIQLPYDLASAERPVLLLVGWLHWGNTSTNVARSQDPAGAPLFPRLEVPDGRGGWRATAVEVGLPAGKTKPVVVELAGAVDPADPRVRITTDFEVYWDRIAVAAGLSAGDQASAAGAEEGPTHRVHRLRPGSARLSYAGFSRWFRPAENGPYVFDPEERRPHPWREDSTGAELAVTWQELEGFYTRFGPVEDLLAEADDRLVVFGAGEELDLRFDLNSLPELPAGWRRTYFLHSEGWEKDGDPNVACGQTVEPLPYRAMTGDPCLEAAPGGPEIGADRRTRWVSRHRLERRVAAFAELRDR